jgi:two-component system, sensor histidine kinase and response regulator
MSTATTSRVFIVDDEPSARDTLESLLLREGHEIFFASSGIQALETLGEVNPDVILLDVMMPGMDGFNVCQQIKSDPVTQHIPVLMVTALDSTQDIVRGLDAGADDFLPKPVNGYELRARVRSMLRIKNQYDDLQAVMRMKKDLSNMMVRDMRGPLSGILAVSEMLLLARTVTVDSLKDIETIRTEVFRLNGLLNDMLSVIRTESNKLTINTEPVSMIALIREATDEYQLVARSKMVSLEVSLPKRSVEREIDRVLVRRVLDNLLTQALRSSGPNQMISVDVIYGSASASLTTITLSVPNGTDRIRGPDLNQEKLTNGLPEFPFCRTVAEAHGGSLTVTDTAGGATYVLSI